MRRLMLAGVMVLAPLVSPAATPGLVGALDLDAPVHALRVTPDARVAVALVGPSGGRPGGLRVIDGSAPAKPVLKGSLAGLSGALALSPDGRQALVAIQSDPARHPTAARWQVVVVDLSDLDHPREVRRLDLQVQDVVLAGNGQALAAVQPVPGGPGRWQATVQWVAGDRQPILVEGAERGDGSAWLSDDARFLARMLSDTALEITALQGAAAATHQQADVFFLPRHGCIPAVLDSGHVVVDDQRMPRLGFYAAAPEVPRVATVAGDGAAWCRRLDANLGPGQLVLADALNRVLRIDASAASNPVPKGPWILPPRTQPLATTAEYLYATAAPARLLVFRWEGAAPATVDWRALDAAHRVALLQYRQSMQPGSAARRAPAPDVLQQLEEAGVLPALEAPVEGVSRQRAAEILNDYGFWARHDAARASLVQQALRRAAELDPGRAVARLNLADWLVGRLPRVTDPKARQASMAEIDALYRRYLALGGRPAHVQPYLQSAAQARRGSSSACEAIASHANAGRLRDLVSDAAAGVVAGGGQRLDLLFSVQGTAREPVIHAFDAATDQPVELAPPGDSDLWGGGLLGLVVHDEGARVLHYRDLRHPVHARSLGEGTDCAFRTTTVEHVGPRAVEPALCRALSRLDGPGDVVFTEPPAMAETTWRGSPATTFEAGPMEPLDLANNGQAVNVVLISHDSTAGAGCRGIHYDVMDANGERLDTGPLHKLISDLQGGTAWCGNSARFFLHNGKTYFESRPVTWPPQDDADRYHRVARIERGRVIDVCDFRIESRISVDR
jgi:hypothetical protein